MVAHYAILEVFRSFFSAHDGMMGLKGITVSNDRNNLPPYIYGNSELENRSHTGGLRS